MQRVNFPPEEKESERVFRPGEKVLHIPSGKIVKVVRDEGGVKVLVRIDSVEVSVLRRNLTLPCWRDMMVSPPIRERCRGTPRGRKKNPLPDPSSPKQAPKRGREL